MEVDIGYLKFGEAVKIGSEMHDFARKSADVAITFDRGFYWIKKGETLTGVPVNNVRFVVGSQKVEQIVAAANEAGDKKGRTKKDL